MKMKLWSLIENKSYFCWKLGFTGNEYPVGKHVSQKFVIVTRTDKIHLPNECIDWVFTNGH